ncbi:MAG: GTPase ObgE [Planctomycetota bacterium]
MAHFVDESKIKVVSGKGGNGCVSFRREKYVSHGGPNGGDGGRGGHVVLVADPQITTLLDIGRQFLYQAGNGQHGMGRDRSGKSGKDLRLRLPVGTLVRDAETNELLADLDQPHLELEIARGGRGGRGNHAFATAVHQVPREAESGGPAEERELHLELKLMADVGLLGFPNAGKSTFLSAVSAAHPKIADYPFTTLAPQLGISEIDDVRRLVIADIPGLIEGASDGVGLGLEFLRHVERTRVLIHLLDPFERDLEALVADFRVIRKELAGYSATLADRPIITAINKVDLLPPDEAQELLGAFSAAIDEPVLGLSAATGQGTRGLLERCWEALRASADELDGTGSGETG